MLYGKDWKKMQPLIKSRSLVQIRTHAQKVFKKIGLKKAMLGAAAQRNKSGDGDALGSSAGGGVGQSLDFDGDDAMVGAEELQLLQQMSQQMMQEEEEEQQRRLRVQQAQQAPLPQQQQAQQHAFSSSSDAGVEYSLPSHTHHQHVLAGMGASSSGAGAHDVHDVHDVGGSLLPEHAFQQQQGYHPAYEYAGGAYGISNQSEQHGSSSGAGGSYGAYHLSQSGSNAGNANSSSGAGVNGVGQNLSYFSTGQ